MQKLAFLYLALFCWSAIWAQDSPVLRQSVRWLAETDTLKLGESGLNPAYFSLTTRQGMPLTASQYRIDFEKAQLVLLDPLYRSDSLVVHYAKWPEFLTKNYTYYDNVQVVDNAAGQSRYRHNTHTSPIFVPFDGLNTSGSISRGLTVGNNQNAVTQSNLDLQITGKLSDRVNLRASIQDSNAPLQDGGYSQKIDEFDQIFMELYSDTWSIKAGDLFLENRKSHFLNFNKKVQGLSTEFHLGPADARTDVEAAVALARGQYAKSEFTGQEGNQGPYKLKGPNGELFILVVSGSEQVFVNGIALKRGEHNDYVIDYNAGEIRFTTLFPITSEMRIAVEYQYTDRNYTRFVGYGGIHHQREKWSFGGYVFTETDIKNQPLQQNLTPEQVAILQQAGNDPKAMLAPSATLTPYTENQILYRKAIDEQGRPYYLQSNNPEDELYQLSFTLMGNQRGDYVLDNQQTVGRIYKYIPPVGEISQGNYAPVVQLVAPIQNTLATVLGQYQPSEKTFVKFEAALSNSDRNLFSNLDQDANQGWATQVNAKQRVLTARVELDVFGDFQFIHQNFHSLERLYSIEFDRDWNLELAQGHQSLWTAGLEARLPGRGSVIYKLEQLTFGENFTANRNHILGHYQSKSWSVNTQNSALKAESDLKTSQFLRSLSSLKYRLDQHWVGARLELEHQTEKDLTSGLLLPLSHGFQTATVYLGTGDSLGVFAELGYSHRVNDSLQMGELQRVSQSHTIYFNSKLIQSKTRNLSLYANLRRLNWIDSKLKPEQSLNSRLVYSDRFLDGLIQTHTTYETSSGTIAQQEFTYLEVEPGMGLYMWVDYNGNGIQELEEFELAPFPDQAKYVRLYLPNQRFVKTHQNKFSQSLWIVPTLQQGQGRFGQFFGRFNNQTTYLIDQRELKEGNAFNFNPFTTDDDRLVGLSESLRNSLYFHRGKQLHSMTYTFLRNNSKNLLSFGTQENKLQTHQFSYVHLIAKTWLLSIDGKTSEATTRSESYASKNFQINSSGFEPKLAYLFSNKASLNVFYEYQNKQNTESQRERLSQHRLGSSFLYANTKGFSFNGELAFYQNKFEGNAFSPVAYQMLEGLQAGKNLTWRLMVQKNLTQYLDLNMNYQGRSNEDFSTIHTGNIQLRAFF